MSKWKRSKDPFAKREAAKYSHPIPSREYIVKTIRKSCHVWDQRQLVDFFKLRAPMEQEAMRRRLRAMVRDGQLIKGRNGAYRLAAYDKVIRGYVIGDEDGFGFLAPQDGTANIFLTHREMRLVMDGDFVAVNIVKIDRKNLRYGHVTKILKRRSSQIVGRFAVDSGIGFVMPNNGRLVHHIVIPYLEQADARAGQIVVTNITRWPTKDTQAIGRIVEVLGDHVSPDFTINMEIRAFGLPHQWEAEVLEEVKQFSTELSAADKQGREDLTHLPFVTIDGGDAKDFDDAVFAEPKPKGGWRLIVAIADVSHYVRPGTALDRAAIERGNSVYFPGRVIPMLPRILSNHLCSLKARVERLCLICDMSLNAAGKVEQYRFYSGIIRSHARLTYKLLGLFLAGETTPIPSRYPKLLPTIRHLYAVYQVLHAQRQKRGALTFETTEVKIKITSSKTVSALVPSVRNDAHRLIEECMVSANVCAARFLLKHREWGIFRVHDGPKYAKIMMLKEFLGELGLKLGGGELPVTGDYAKLLLDTQDRPDAHLIQTVLLRSLRQAFYAADHGDGHFGLALSTYTHFTSPIRRYADLIVHRMIHAIIQQDEDTLAHYQADTIQELAEHCSMTERRADDAVMNAVNWLKCQYMFNKIDQQFEGVITHVTGYGIFVELRNIFVEGLVHIAAMEDDFYHLDHLRHRLIGERTHKTYRIGDVVQVKLVRVDLDRKHIDLVLV